jgi:hypothetical protein
LRLSCRERGRRLLSAPLRLAQTFHQDLDIRIYLGDPMYKGSAGRLTQVVK